MELKEFAKELAFPEGPVALKDGSVLVVELYSRALKRLYPDGRSEILATVEGALNGAALGPDGIVLLANNGGMSWEEHDGLVAPGPQPHDYKGGKIQVVFRDGQVSDLYTQYEEWSYFGSE